MPNALDLIDQRYGRLTAMKAIKGSRKWPRSWLCRCDCGTYSTVVTGSLTRGLTKSCGCLNREINKKRQLGAGNNLWKGNAVKYGGLHEWVRRRKPKPEFCEFCGLKPPNDLANISGEYRRDVNDYEWLCRKCHMEKDGRINNLKRYQIHEKDFAGGVVREGIGG